MDNKSVTTFFGFLARVLGIKSLSVYKLTLIFLVITALVSIGLITAFWVYSDYKYNRQSIKDLAEETLFIQKESLKGEVLDVLCFLDYSLTDTSTYTLKEKQTKALNYIKDIRFGEDGYIFINTYKGKALIFDGKMENGKRNIKNLTDPNGLRIFEMEKELAKLPDGGYFEYLFKKMNDTISHSKLSYVKGFNDWGWIIGAGDYLENLDEEIELLEAKLIQELRKHLIKVFGVTVTVMLLLIFISSLFATSIQNQFNNFTLLLKQNTSNRNKKEIFENLFIRDLRKIGVNFKQTEEDARQLGEIIDQSKNEVFIFNQDDLLFVHASRGALDNCGYSLTELKNLTPLDLQPEINNEQYKSLVKSLNLNLEEKISFETNYLRKDSTLYPAEVQITASMFFHKPVYVAVVYDITERVKAKVELLNEKEFSEKIIETSNAVIVGLDKNHSIKIFNKGAERVTGYKQKDVIGKDWFEIFFPAEIQNEMNVIWHEAWGALSHSYENIILSKNGEEKIISWQSTGYYDDDDINKHLLISIGENITERIKSEEALNTATKIISRGPAVAFLWRNEKDWPVEFVSENIERLTGYTAKELMAGKPSYLKLIHKEDVNKVNKEVSKYSNKEDITSFTHEPYRIITKNNKIKWVNDITFMRRDSFGLITHFEGIVYDITDIKLTELALKESESRFRSIYENNHTVMFLINPETGRFIDANPAAINFYGYSQEKFLTELSVYDLNTLSKEVVIKLLEEAKAKNQNYYTFKHILSNGDIRDVEVYSGPLSFLNEQVLFSIVHDITEKQNAIFELELSRNKLDSIFRAAPTGIGVVSNRILTEVNQMFCEMMGYKEEELLGKESIILYPSKEEFEWVGKEKYEQIREKGTGTVETKLKHKDGHTVEVLLSSTPMDMDDLSVGVTFTALDISQRKKDLDELENHRNHLEEIVKERTDELENSQDALLNLVDDLNLQSKELEYANKKLEDINQELETFTYSVSHDLKAPLRGIDGYSQLLMSSFTQDMNPDAHEFLGNIRKSTQQMNALIEDLLAYSRMERKDFQTENILFKPIVNKILLHFSEIIKKNKVEIKLSFPEEFALIADKDGLNLVLRNLLDNALKFSNKENNSLIEIGSDENDKHWHIFVKDNGVGFDMKYHDRIYKIFQRLHLAEEYEGTGIGLAMVSKSMQRMNGKIWAESKPGKGACFYLEINKALNNETKN